VLPFQNQAVVLKALPWQTLKAALISAIQTCGRYGTLVQSGLKIEYSRDCSGANGENDLNAKLISVKAVDGIVFLDTNTGQEVPASTPISVATLDFIASGGSGYGMFSGTQIDSSLGIVREIIADAFAKTQPTLNDKIDHRFINLAPQK
jgi:hypothetical protein